MTGSPRGRRRVVAALLVTVVIAASAVAGIAWYFSTLAVAVDHGVSYDERAWPGRPGTVLLTADHYAGLPGRYGLEWPGGYATVGAVVQPAGAAAPPGAPPATTIVARSLTVGSGRLQPGAAVSLDPFAYQGDPRTALGLDFRTVRIPGELGEMPAWYVPAADGRTDRSWLVFVHGHDSNPQESLRYLTALHALGLPVLVICYRNDAGAPASPDGADHLGDTEWHEVDAALRWARTRGARDVVLGGWSMGGAVALQAWDRSDLRGFVRGMILDSPVIDWRDVLTYQGGVRHLPEPLTALSLWALEQRFGIDLGRFDWARRAGELSLPILMFAPDDDSYVPSGPADALAAARPDLVTLVDVPGADHTRSWNVDPVAYERHLTTWLTAVAALPSG
jgi:uncharacterized protein